MSIMHRITALTITTAIACASVTAFADDHPYREGPVVNVARIRTVDGHFEDYMKWLSTKWKQQQEAAKKAGYIVSYQIMTIQPRGPEDADILLMTTYKNWAALDGSIAKGDALAKQVEGSVALANQAEADRAKIRTVLGSATMQVLDLN